MDLILADSSDASAVWACRQLRARGRRAEFVTPHELVTAARWEHRVGAGGASVSIRLRRGLAIESVEVRGVLNRIAGLPLALFVHMRAQDRAYAQQEMSALLASCLRAMGDRQGPLGAWRRASEWAVLAERVGMPAGPARGKAIVVGREAFGVGFSIPEELRDAAVELAAMARAPLLGIDFGDDGAFASASPRPEFHLAGSGAIYALIAMWEGGSR